MAWKLTEKTYGNLLDDTEIPVAQKSPFIISGYRPKPRGWCDLFFTIFTLHNESGNIWTHLIGCGYFVSVGVQLLLDLSADYALQGDAVWLVLLVMASAYCLFASFTYHLCTCTANSVRDCTHKMDLSGIVVLIAMSYFAGIALGYRCYPRLRCFYLVYAACISLLLAGPLLWPSLVRDKNRHLIGCCAAGALPALHFVCIAEWEDTAVVGPHLVSMFGCYGIGAAFFITHWPERSWPGRFDFFGHSHQMWHVFVVLAAASWLRGCRMFFKVFDAAHCEQLALLAAQAFGANFARAEAALEGGQAPEVTLT